MTTTADEHQTDDQAVDDQAPDMPVDNTVEVRILTPSIAGIDPETGEAWTYSTTNRAGDPIADPRVRCRADRAQELIMAGAAELTDAEDNPSPVELDQRAVQEREAMRDRIRLAEREKRLAEDERAAAAAEEREKATTSDRGAAGRRDSR